MKDRSDLTPYELTLLQRLEKSGHINGSEYTPAEVGGMNRLVKKGFATTNGNWRWQLKLKRDPHGN